MHETNETLAGTQDYTGVRTIVDGTGKKGNAGDEGYIGRYARLHLSSYNLKCPRDQCTTDSNSPVMANEKWRDTLMTRGAVQDTQGTLFFLQVATVELLFCRVVGKSRDG